MVHAENIKDFIKSHYCDDVDLLRLKYSSHENRDSIFFGIDQIDCRRRFGNKLSIFIVFPDFLFPDVLSGEQSSHQSIAAYNASVVGSKGDILDMTAGLGIDSFSMARNTDGIVTAIEIDSLKTEILRHNKSILNLENLNIINKDSISYLIDSEKFYDIIFVDPARRSDIGTRVFSFSHSRPNIIENWNIISSHCDRVVIKASPMLDITQCLTEIPDVRTIHVVCYKGECKELLVESSSKGTGISIRVVDLKEGKDKYFSCITDFSFDWDRMHTHFEIVKMLEPEGKYLCIPNAGIMKVAAWGELAERYEGLKKLSANTHLFISDRIPVGFPGRVVKISRVLNNKSLKGLKDKYRNVFCRNYPLTPDQLTKKAGVITGGNDYIVGCRITEKEKPILFECSASLT